MPKFLGLTSRDKPTSASDTSNLNLSLTHRGELKTIQLLDNHSCISDEGAYFKASTPAGNASFGSHIASIAAADSKLNDSSATMAIVNSSGNPMHNISIDYIRVAMTSSNSALAGAKVLYAVTTNPYDRFGSASAGATALITYSTNSVVTTSPIAKVYSSTATSATSGNLLTLGGFSGSKLNIHARGKFKDAGTATLSPYVLGDVYTLDFGDHKSEGQSYSASLAGQYAASTGPLILGPGQFMAFHIWCNSTVLTPSTLDLEVGWWER